MLRATPGSARNLAVMEEELGHAAGRNEALQILQPWPKDGGN